LKAKGVDHIPRFFRLFSRFGPSLIVDLSGEFSLYDHVLDLSAAFNVIPKRYVGQGLTPLDVYFAMGRGRQADGVDVPASEMKKWCAPRFDQKYPVSDI
jgi:5-methyltetrahydropteroyltriglutamate--homocysteine methyltransferase